MVLLWQALCWVGILGLYDSRPADLFGSGTEDLLKAGREAARKWRTSWYSRLLLGAWLARRTQRAGKMGREMEA